MLMVSLQSNGRRIRTTRHRVAALVVLVLQLAMAGSAVWESRTEVWLGVHVEGDGTAHLGQHNETTCGLCSARTLAALPTMAVEPIASHHGLITAAVFTQSAPASARPSRTRSRAPPSLLA
jgi:hypothetical protein